MTSPVRWLTPFEYCLVAGVVITLVTWRDPGSLIPYGEYSNHLGLLQGFGVGAAMALGIRGCFLRDQKFAGFQFVFGVAVGTFPAMAAGGAQAMAGNHHSLVWAAAGWLMMSVTAAFFLLPKTHHAVQPRRYRLKFIAPVIAFGIIAAVLTPVIFKPPPSEPYWKKFVPAEGAR